MSITTSVLVWWLGLALLVLTEMALNINSFILVVILGVAYGWFTFSAQLYPFPFQYRMMGKRE